MNFEFLNPNHPRNGPFEGLGVIQNSKLNIENSRDV